MKKIVLVLLSILFSVQVYAASTTSKTINRLQGNGNSIYAQNPSGWGASGCSSAIYAFIDKNNEHFSELYVMLLLAHASGKTVRFLGECHSSNYFKANYIIVN